MNVPRELDRAAVARHEAGHAVMLYLLGLPVGDVSVTREGAYEGRVSLGEPTSTRGVDAFRQCRDLALVSLAGPMSDRLSGTNLEAAGVDYARARQLIAKAMPIGALPNRDHLLEAYLKFLIEVATYLLSKNRRAIRGFAAELEERGRLSATETAALLEKQTWHSWANGGLPDWL